MRLITIAIVTTVISACTYGPDSGVYRSNTYNYPPVGYVLRAQEAPNLKTCPNPQYQTFWTYDQNGRFNPTQQYVCAPPDNKTQLEVIR